MPLTVGTAGHIDHGKTWLVRALTGKDTDRLPEEQRRGISIDLGYAPLELGDGRRLSVIDVPGHERFVRTMVAGATGIASMNVLVYDRGTNQAKPGFTFNVPNSALSRGTTWYTANEYAVIFTTWTYGNPGRLLVYTDNMVAPANPRYVGADTAKAAGLVTSTTTMSGAPALTLAWRVTDVSTTTLTIGYNIDEDGLMHLYNPTLGVNYRCFHMMRDKGDGEWYTEGNIPGAVKLFSDIVALRGIQHAEGGMTSDTPSPDYFYLGVNIENAYPGRTYKTNAMRFDLIFD
jgi:hypothetical protein